MLIKLHRKARLMLLGIAAYYAERGGYSSVHKLTSTINEKSNHLLKFPETGFPEPLLAGRRFLYRSILINHNIKMVYYVVNDTIHIAAFWDMRMSPERLRKKV